MRHTGEHGAKGKVSWRAATSPGKQMHVPASEPDQPKGPAPVSDQPGAVGDAKQSPELSEGDSPEGFPEELPEEFPGLLELPVECLVPTEAQSK